MCVVKEFCCGCALRHGAITAAVLNAIAAIGLIAVGGQVIYVAQNLPKNHPQFPEYDDSGAKMGTIVGAVVLVLGLLALGIFSCLVIGIAKNIAGLVMPWLIGCMIIIVISGIMVIMQLVLGNFLALINLLVMAFYIYLWIVVFNYYKELRDVPPAYSPEIKA